MATDTKTRKKIKTTKPPMFKVMLLNDDYTTWNFVVFVLVRFFGKSEAEANKLTLDVHQKGIVLAGVYEHEIAETKANQVIMSAQREGFPFRAVVEPE